MSIFKSLGAAAALAMVAPITANAATSLLEEVTINFGTGGLTVVDQNRPVTPATNPPTTEGVLIQDFNFFNTLADFNISHFSVVLEISGVGDAPAGGFSEYDPNVTPIVIGGLAEDGSDNTPGTENWFVEIAGGAGGANSAFAKRLTPDSTRLDNFFDFDLNAADDEANDDALTSNADRIDGIANTAFTRSVNQNQIKLRFRENSGGTDDQFQLLSATVQVYEVAAPVPVPASGLLLLGAVGGVAAWKRRKTAS